MNTDKFYKEIKERFQHFGKVSAAYSNDGSQSFQQVDYIWITDNSHTNITVHINDLQTNPKVIFDVYGNLSVSYPLGTPTATVLACASKRYASKPHALEVIKRDTDLILDAFKVANCKED